jgi:hypothetical protein
MTFLSLWHAVHQNSAETSEAFRSLRRNPHIRNGVSCYTKQRPQERIQLLKIEKRLIRNPDDNGKEGVDCGARYLESESHELHAFLLRIGIGIRVPQDVTEVCVNPSELAILRRVTRVRERQAD